MQRINQLGLLPHLLLLLLLIHQLTRMVYILSLFFYDFTLEVIANPRSDKTQFLSKFIC